MATGPDWPMRVVRARVVLLFDGGREAHWEARDPLMVSIVPRYHPDLSPVVQDPVDLLGTFTGRMMSGLTIALQGGLPYAVQYSAGGAEIPPEAAERALRTRCSCGAAPLEELRPYLLRIAGRPL